jgi:hypothetical protein
MADQSGDPSGNIGDYHYQARTCRSVTLVDPCSDDIRNFTL